MDSHTSVLHPSDQSIPSTVPGKLRWAFSPHRIVGRLRQWQYDLTSDYEPNLAPDAVESLARVLDGSGTGIEWGSGRSTPWLANRLGKLVSVEHDPQWHRWVTQHLPADSNADCLLRCFGNETPTECAYVQTVEQFEDESLDFCLIDGRMRLECALAVLPKIAHGGLLVLDDVQRYLKISEDSGRCEARMEPWEPFARRISGWPCLWERSLLRDTAIWVKLV